MKSRHYLKPLNYGVGLKSCSDTDAQLLPSSQVPSHYITEICRPELVLLWDRNGLDLDEIERQNSSRMTQIKPIWPLLDRAATT